MLKTTCIFAADDGGLNGDYQGDLLFSYKQRVIVIIASAKLSSALTSVMTHLISVMTPLDTAGGACLATVTPTSNHFCLTESNEQVINPCQLLLNPARPNRTSHIEL